MVGHWAQFAHHGEADIDDVPAWPADDLTARDVALLSLAPDRTRQLTAGAFDAEYRAPL
ncbi:MAG: hypothetical protein OXU20_09760 [Myxococcales bacterium]|nr:hypothetical protein [Myxococcales bacterium]